jgi:hypothetical protein
MDRGRLGWTRNLVRVDRWWNGLASSERGRPRLYMWSVAFRGDQGCDLRSSINQPSGGAVVWTLDVTPRRRVASMPRNETVRLAVASRACPPVVCGTDAAKFGGSRTYPPSHAPHRMGWVPGVPAKVAAAGKPVGVLSHSGNQGGRAVAEGTTVQLVVTSTFIVIFIDSSSGYHLIF